MIYAWMHIGPSAESEREDFNCRGIQLMLSATSTEAMIETIVGRLKLIGAETAEPIVSTQADDMVYELVELPGGRVDGYSGIELSIFPCQRNGINLIRRSHAVEPRGE